jgi:hypothetical protein
MFEPLIQVEYCKLVLSMSDISLYTVVVRPESKFFVCVLSRSEPFYLRTRR